MRQGVAYFEARTYYAGSQNERIIVKIFGYGWLMEAVN